MVQDFSDLDRPHLITFSPLTSRGSRTFILFQTGRPWPTKELVDLSILPHEAK